MSGDETAHDGARRGRGHTRATLFSPCETPRGVLPRLSDSWCGVRPPAATRGAATSPESLRWAVVAGLVASRCRSRRPPAPLCGRLLRGFHQRTARIWHNPRNRCSATPETRRNGHGERHRAVRRRPVAWVRGEHLARWARAQPSAGFAAAFPCRLPASRQSTRPLSGPLPPAARPAGGHPVRWPRAQPPPSSPPLVACSRQACRPSRIHRRRRRFCLPSGRSPRSSDDSR